MADNQLKLNEEKPRPKSITRGTLHLRNFFVLEATAVAFCKAGEKSPRITFHG